MDDRDNKKTKILFVCLGNICRSPMAEFIFRRKVSRGGYEDYFEVSSAGTSDEEEGNPVYTLARRELAEHGIGCKGKVACKITEEMFAESDYVVVMEESNKMRLCVEFGVKMTENKVFKLSQFLDAGDPLKDCDIADPWYTRDFKTAYSQINHGCDALLSQLVRGLGLE